MSKVITKDKIGEFYLDRDAGFSIHTFELSYKLTDHDFRSLKNEIYNNTDYHVYKEVDIKSQTIYRCRAFENNGVRITIEHNHPEFHESFYVRMIVNPRKLIEPDCSHFGIFPSDEKSLNSLREEFLKLFKDTAFSNDISTYKLSRVDLCVNLSCTVKAIFAELFRVLRKLPAPPKYTRAYHEGKDKKENSKYNKHYIRFKCGTHEIVIYDKTFQLENCGLLKKDEQVTERTLRVEIHIDRTRLRKIEKKTKSQDSMSLLWYVIQHSEEMIIKQLYQCFPDVCFMRMDKLIEVIQASKFRKKDRKAMIELSKSLQHLKTVDQALQMIANKGYNSHELLNKFDHLGVSPIPLRKKFCAEEIPGLTELVSSVSISPVSIPYKKIKYK